MELHRWCLTEFYMWLCLRRNFPPLALHRGILNFSCVLILLIDAKHKYKNMKSWTDLTSHFFDGDLIYLVDRAKDVWLIIGQLPIKSGWWNAPLALQDFSRSNKHEDSHKESLWFPAFPPWFPAIPTFPELPAPLPAFPPWFPVLSPLFPAFPPWFPAFPSFHTFRFPIPYSGFYRSSMLIM